MFLIIHTTHQAELVKLLSNFLVGVIDFSHYHRQLIDFTKKPFYEWKEVENDLKQLRKFEYQISTADLYNTIEELVDLCELEKFTILEMATECGYSVNPSDWLTVFEIKEQVNQIRARLIKK